MEIETFFEKFDLFAEAPGAVGKLHELVLELAVQGRLVKPSGKDMPVTDLVSQLAKEKEKAVENTRRSKTKLTSTSEERPFTIPEHWAWVRLCDIGTISGGHTPSKNKSMFWNGDVQWFTSKDIKSDELFESNLKITDAAAESPGLQLYPPGCLFMVARSGILKRTFPVAINRVPATVNQDLKVLNPFVPGLERYLQIMFRGLTRFILKSLVKTGMTVQSLKYDEFASHPFPLPPLAEQKRIVAKVEQLMGWCDRLEAQQQEHAAQQQHLARAAVAQVQTDPTPEHLEALFHPSYDITPEDLRKTILTLAVQGKLVEQDSNDGSAESLLERIVKFKIDNPLLSRQGRSKKNKSTAKTGSIYVPPGWVATSIGQVLYVIRGSSPRPKGDPRYFSESRTRYHWVKISDIRKYGQDGLLMDTDEFLTEEGMRKSVLLPKGTLVLTNSATIGVPIVLGVEGCCIHDGYLAFPNFPHDLLDQQYILYLFNNLKEHAERNARGLAQLNLNTDLVRSFAFALPPLAEQKRIVAKVDQLMARVDALEAQLAAASDTAQQLLDALVHELTTPGIVLGSAPGS